MESGQPAPITSREFREAMARVASAVHIVSADSPEGPIGFTATAFSGVSDNPPTLLVCVNAASESRSALIHAGAFAVNTLAASDQWLADVFSGRTDVPRPDRFGQGSWDTILTGAPVLRTSLVSFDCRVVAATEMATHYIVIGEILATRIGPREASLVYLDRAYRGV